MKVNEFLKIFKKITKKHLIFSEFDDIIMRQY
jgi:ribosomal protein S21